MLNIQPSNESLYMRKIRSQLECEVYMEEVELVLHFLSYDLNPSIVWEAMEVSVLNRHKQLSHFIEIEYVMKHRDMRAVAIVYIIAWRRWLH